MKKNSYEKKKAKTKRPHMLPNLLIFSLLRRPKNAADKIHLAYAIYYWRQCRTIRRRLSVLRSFILSPLKTINEIRKNSGLYGVLASSHAGKSLSRQIIEQIYLAYFFSIDSRSYYLQEFYRKDGIKRARCFVNKEAIKNGSYRLLGSYGRYTNSNNDFCSLGRKIEFTLYCLKKGIPVVPVSMVFYADGTVKDFREKSTDILPQEDLFLKPNIDNEGQGAEAWFWRGSDKYESSDGEVLGEQELRKRVVKLASRHRNGLYLVQPLMRPHSELAVFRKNATPTVRIFTYIDHNGGIKVEECGMFRFSRSNDAVVDNASAGGMVAPINTATGILGAAVDESMETSGNRWERHQENGAQIDGLLLPYWEEVRKLVVKAQEAFPHRLVIGWDIIVTENGPLILEGNSQPGLCFMQKAHLKSLGEMEIGKVKSEYLEKAVSTLYSGVFLKESKQQSDVIDFYNGSKLRRWFCHYISGCRKKVNIVISGKVQGVYYRKWLNKQASACKVNGWVRNRSDGKVEAVLEGRAVDVEDVVRACWAGSKDSRVKSVEISWYKKAITKGFQIIK